MVQSEESNAALLALIPKSDFLSGFSTPFLNVLVRGARPRLCSPNQTLFWEGEPCAGLHVLESGAVKLFKVAPNGRQLTIRIIEAPGQSFNEVPVLDMGKNAVNVSTLEETRLWVISAESVQAAMRAFPDQYQIMVLKLAANLRGMIQIIEELAFYQVTARLARLLLSLPPQRLTGEENQRPTQQELAARLGTVREVVARSLRDLERSRAIQIHRRHILILDPQRLQAWASGSPDLEE
mgnify:CR=1 FL=1